MERIAVQTGQQSRSTGAALSRDTVHNIPFMRNAHFTGRDAMLSALHNTLRISSWVQLNEPFGGIGGAGKTQLALEYSYRFGGHYGLVWWIYGERVSQIAAAFAQISEKLRLLPGKTPTQSEEIEAVRQWLSANGNWLIVLDGVEQPYDFKRFLPDSDTGKLLITSRHEQPSLPFTVIPVTYFTAQEALHYLHTMTGRPPDAAMEAVAKGMGGMPLALSLAGAYCRGAGMTFLDYGRQLQAQLEKLKPRQRDARALLAAILLTHFDHLAKTNLACLDLAAFCAYLSPEDISLPFLKGAAESLPPRLGKHLSNPESTNKLIGALKSLGLVSLHEHSLETHPLIQVITRELMNQEQRHTWAAAALRATESAFPVEQAYTHAIPGCTRLLGHSLTAAYHAGSYEIEPELTGALLNQVGLYLYGCNEPVEAQVCYERSIALARRLHGDLHPVVAARINNLGVVHQGQKRLKEARRCYEKAFSIIESLFGQTREDFYNPSDESMLTLPVYNLCNVLMEMEDLSGARTAYSRAIPIFQNVYSWNHPLVAESLNSVGKIWHREGRLPKALKCFESAILSEENTEHPNTARITHYLNNAAMVLMDMEKPLEAQTQVERALGLTRELYNEPHCDLLRELMTLGRVYRAQERNMEAKESFEEALQLSIGLEGPRGYQTGRVRSFLGRACQLCEEFDEALTHFEMARDITMELKGPDCDELVTDYINLGRLHADTARFPDAIDNFERALYLDAKYKALTQDLLATVLNRLGRCLQALDRHEDALVYYQRALIIDRNRYGEYHGNVARDIYYIGSAQAHLGDSVKAIANLMQSLDAYERLLGKNHPKVSRIRKKIDQLNRKQVGD
ncbi:MAG: tetratricopeptide repeat protein [Candidatus Hydrogenedentes bacterium]|nr:tetratricopeptide repeat protein [Candidatus Hydrogenedentota bacterium]